MKNDNKRGPKPDRLRIDGKWKDSVGKALQKKRPKQGWPKKKKRKPEKSGTK